MNENGRGRLIENVIYMFEYYPYFFFSKKKNQESCNFTYKRNCILKYIKIVFFQ